MIESPPLALAWAAGVVLGGIFYGGLWWTVVRGVEYRRAGAVFLGSLLLRTGIVLAGLYFVSGGEWQRLLPGLMGFVMARAAVAWVTRPAKAIPPSHVEGAGHAS